MLDDSKIKRPSIWPVLLGARAPTPAQRAEHAQILASVDYFVKTVLALRAQCGRGRVPSIKPCL